MTTKEMIDVMLAYERGEQIEWRIKNGNRGWGKQRKPPVWDWNNFEYRVKPQSTYRPYKNADEFLQAQKEHGMYLVRLLDDEYVFPMQAQYNFVAVAEINITDFVFHARKIKNKKLLESYQWQDGTPCGVKEE